MSILEGIPMGYWREKKTLPGVSPKRCELLQKSWYRKIFHWNAYKEQSHRRMRIWKKAFFSSSTRAKSYLEKSVPRWCKVWCHYHENQIIVVFWLHRPFYTIHLTSLPPRHRLFPKNYMRSAANRADAFK